MVPVLSKSCVIHYESVQCSENLISVDNARFEELVNIKQCRQQLGSKFIHSEQASGIPHGFKDGLFYHRECYANFSRARTDFKKRRLPLKEIDQNTGIQRPQRSRDVDSSGRWPDHCWFCKQKKAKRVRSKNKDILEPIKVVNPDVKETLLNAAKQRNDETLLRCIDIDTNLHHKGFKKHSSCYSEYTKILYAKKGSQEGKTSDTNETIRKAVETIVFEERRCISLDELLNIKGGKEQEQRQQESVEKMARSKLQWTCIFECRE